MARLTMQQLRVMEQRDRRNTRQAATGVVALALILAGAVWWLCVTLPILCVRWLIRFSVWLTRTFSWRGWVAIGILLAAAVVLGLLTSGH